MVCFNGFYGNFQTLCKVYILKTCRISLMPIKDSHGTHQLLEQNRKIRLSCNLWEKRKSLHKVLSGLLLNMSLMVKLLCVQTFSSSNCLVRNKCEMLDANIFDAIALSGFIRRTSLSLNLAEWSTMNVDTLFFYSTNTLSIVIRKASMHSMQLT